MIKMSLDKETILPHELSPAFPTTVSLSEQPQLAKTRPLRSKNGLHLPRNSQPPLATSAPPAQRIAKRRYSMGVGLKGLAKRRRRANSDSQSEPVLPSHFLMGGNIFDPLNLNSLLDEDVNKWDWLINWSSFSEKMWLLFQLLEHENLFIFSDIYHINRQINPLKF